MSEQKHRCCQRPLIERAERLRPGFSSRRGSGRFGISSVRWICATIRKSTSSARSRCVRSRELAASRCSLNAASQRGPPPVHGAWRENLLVLTHGLLPIYVQFASYKLFPSYTWNPWAAYLFYHLSFIYWAYTMVNVRIIEAIRESSLTSLAASAPLHGAFCASPSGVSLADARMNSPCTAPSMKTSVGETSRAISKRTSSLLRS